MKLMILCSNRSKIYIMTWKVHAKTLEPPFYIVGYVEGYIKRHRVMAFFPSCGTETESHHYGEIVRYQGLSDRHQQ